MPRRRPPLLAVIAPLLACLLGTAARADPRPPIVGDDAPPIVAARWIHGEPVENLDRGQVYVIDFWSPDVGACRATVPHLNAIAKKFPSVTFVGVAVEAFDAEEFDASLKRFATPIEYRACVDRPMLRPEGDAAAGATRARWLPPVIRGDGMATAFVVAGRPTTFIVDADGTIAWAGSPMRIEGPLSQVIAGTLDREPGRRAGAAALVRLEKLAAADRDLEAVIIDRARRPRDNADELLLRERIFSKYPEAAPEMYQLRIRRLAAANQFDDLYAAADAWAVVSNGDADGLNTLAWLIVGNDEHSLRLADPDVARARRYAERAVELSDGVNAAILDTLARAVFLHGDVAKAIELQTRAVELANVGEPELLRGTLATYIAKRDAPTTAP